MAEFEIEYVQGIVPDQRFVFVPTIDFRSLGISVYALFDSVLVGAEMRYVYSDEQNPVFSYPPEPGYEFHVFQVRD